MSTNSAAQYTPPGPWEVVENSWCRTTVYDANGFEIASLHIDDELDGGPALEAEKRMVTNARLIAAAPDLLAALMEMHTALQLVLSGKDGKQYANLETRSGSFVSMAPLMQQAESALAKALGEQPQ